VTDPDAVDAGTVYGCIGYLQNRALVLRPKWTGDEPPTVEEGISLWWAGYARAVQELRAVAPFRPDLIPDDLSELDS
jgi:hypothetical protein